MGSTNGLISSIFIGNWLCYPIPFLVRCYYITCTSHICIYFVISLLCYPNVGPKRESWAPWSCWPARKKGISTVFKAPKTPMVVTVAYLDQSYKELWPWCLSFCLKLNMAHSVPEFSLNADWLWIIPLIVDILIDFDFLSPLLESGYVPNQKRLLLILSFVHH